MCVVLGAVPSKIGARLIVAVVIEDGREIYLRDRNSTVKADLNQVVIPLLMYSILIE